MAKGLLKKDVQEREISRKKSYRKADKRNQKALAGGTWSRKRGKYWVKKKTYTEQTLSHSEPGTYINN